MAEIIGAALDRVDGRLKVTGGAHYAAEAMDFEAAAKLRDRLRLVYARREKAGKRALYDCQVADGTTRNITGDAGDFGSPAYSPQKSGG